MRWSIWRGAALALVGFVAAGAAAGEPAGGAVLRIRGTVVALDAYALRLMAGARPVSVTLSPDYGVTALLAAPPADVAPGRFVGAVATRDAKGVLKARELHVFPAKLSGGAGGMQPFDLGPGSVVVTGTVEQGLADGMGGTVTLAFPAGINVVLVPPGTPVVTFGPGQRSMLVPGAHVVVEATGVVGGPWRADHVMVGVDGLVPQI